MHLFFDSILFILFFSIGAYLPGRLLVSFAINDESFFSSFFLSTSLGLLLFTLFAYIFAFLHVPFLLLPVCILTSIFSLLTKKIKRIQIPREHILPLGISVLFALIFASITYVTGVFGNTLVYRHDDLWHLMLMHEMLFRFTPNNPGFAGIPLHGYHFFYDFLLASITKSFGVSVNFLFFRSFPVLISFLWAIGVYQLVFIWTKNKWASVWGIFLTMFGGSFGYGLLLQNHPGFSWDSSLGIAQPASSLMNPPFTISIVFLLTGLLLLFAYFKTKNTKLLIPFVLVVGLTAMFKVYAGILLMASYCFLVYIELLKKNRIILWTIPFVALLFFSTYWVFASGSGYLIWYPLWSPHSILQSFPWYHYDNKMYVYTQLHVIHGLVQTEIDGMTVFILGNLGTRLFGLLLLFYFWLQKKKPLSVFAYLLFFLSGVAFFIPLLFLQSGKVFEIIQMAWYFLFIAGIAASVGLAEFFQQKFSSIVKIFFILLFALLTLPSAIEVLKGINETSIFNPQDPSQQVIIFLAKDPVYSHTILELPDQNITTNIQTQQWYIHQLPTLATFGNKQGFVANEFIDFPGVPINERLASITKVMHTLQNPTDNNLAELNTFLSDNQIIYIYSPMEQPTLLLVPGIKEIFHNTSGALYMR